MKFSTKSVHAGRKPDPTTGAVTTPIYQTSTFVFDDYNQPKEHDYSRTSNPTRSALEDALAALEGGNAGFTFSSGMSAISTTLHLLKSGDHVIASDDIYGGTYRLFDEIMSKFGIETTFMKLNDEEAIIDAIKPNTKLIWVETPSNPLVNITDLEMIAKIAKEHDLLSVSDNTFATPYFLKPIDFGIDLVVHSTTKYLNGHSDVIGGAVITTTPQLAEDIHFLLNGLGTNAAPFDSWLVLRGIKSLPVRMKQHEKSAIAVAEFLFDHPAVDEVYFPGLESHQGYEIAKKQMQGYGGVVSFNLKSDVKTFLNKLDLFLLAESLGGADSLVEHAATMSHSSMDPEARLKTGITDQLIRLSIGLEDVDDLIEDLAKGLD
ncbi:MAG: PLP-dependent aspartate aminotransferase family protein [Methanobacteriaceae archaeon]|nr:PLP-dependent aspartate aminotransferase family protein [Methanobacteriaceae archaeon]MDP2835375.1 PLP-dependent aspartate aminotransferase family protein [Methanobacteriaceae archaeon]MDP3485245.1 PLP-dependent aspartate aminotransferase family protein [Methanobacteriaceae archaeon]MDP3623164.1 PLP-dependent aspartate aminotransferase family protein [Methanobacteriaceae archaeon]